MSSDKAVKGKVNAAAAGAGAGSPSGRRLLTTVQHSLHPRIMQFVCPNVGGGSKNIIDPLIVKCSSPKASFSLAFDMITRDPNGYYNVDVEVRDVDAPNLILQIEATVEWYKRPANTNVTSETDKSKWPAPETPIKVTLDGEGRIGSFTYYTLRSLTVHLEVYSLDGCSFRASNAVLDGLNALRLKETLSDVELKVDGKEFPAHRAVLAANSPVFSSMFTSDLKEAQEGYVEIEGTSSTAFGLFLEFLYSGKIADWKGCEIELLELADRYLVDSLQAVCEERLLQMDWGTALGILQHADKPVISSDVRMRATQVVVDNWDAVFITPRWRDFQVACPVLADLIRVARNCLLKKT